MGEICIQTLRNHSEMGRGSKGFPSRVPVRDTTAKENRQLLNSSFTVGLDSTQDCTDNTLSVALQKYLNLLLNIFFIANSQIN